MTGGGRGGRARFCHIANTPPTQKGALPFTTHSLSTSLLSHLTPPAHAHVQVTVFMALLVLDAKRLAQSRLDCLPCLRVPYRDATGGIYFIFRFY